MSCIVICMYLPASTTIQREEVRGYLLASSSYLEKSHNWTEYADHVDADDIVVIADDVVEFVRDASPVTKNSILLSCFLTYTLNKTPYGSSNT